MHTKDIAILLVGIGGHGHNFVKTLLEHAGDAGVTLAGAVDPHPEGCRELEALQALGIPIVDRMESFFKTGRADLAVISTPIQFHCPQTCLALAHGCHVLCEKPIGATVADALRMIEARDRAGKMLAIGYNASYSAITQRLKSDIRAGRFGRPLQFKTLILRPRTHAYYRRGWAGKCRDADGNWILDSVAANSTAHFLHNMFFVLGDRPDHSALPQQVTAELYRANAIENFDTVAARIVTRDHVEMLYYATHATLRELGPIYAYKFEEAEILFPDGQDGIVARFHDGRRIVYGEPEVGSAEILWRAVDALRLGKPMSCSAEGATAHTLCIQGMQASTPTILDFPSALTRVHPDPETTWVEGLDTVLEAAYREGTLPSETGVAWARQGTPITVDIPAVLH